MHSHVLELLREEPNHSSSISLARQEDAHEEPRSEEHGTNGCIRRSSVAYAKFLIPPGTSGRLPNEELPHGLVWSSVQEKDMRKILASTTIPRTARTLMELPSVAVRRGEGELVAWAFLGLDASLTSLHVDENLRGSGMGKKVAQLAFGLLPDATGFPGIQDGEEWCHGDTEWSNLGSIGVMRGLGGEFGWNCHWVSLDLRKVSSW